MFPFFLFTIRLLYERAKTESVDQLLRHITSDGKFIDDKDIVGGKDYSSEMKRLKVKVRSGHLYETLAQLLIFSGCSSFRKEEQVYIGKLGYEKKLENEEEYLDGNINTGNSS